MTTTLIARLRMFVPWIWIVPILGADWGAVHAQTAAVVPVRRDRGPIASINADTKWTFHAMSPVSFDSPIVYLRDVVRPHDPDLAAWQRLGRSPIGLVPANGTPMIIRRERLAEAIRAAEATAALIEIQGPRAIQVVFDRSEKRAAQAAAVAIPKTGVAASVDGQAVDDQVRHAVTVIPADQAPPLEPAIRKRLLYWIETAVAQYDDVVTAGFEVAMPPDQPVLGRLADARRIREVRFIDPVGEGMRRITVVGDTAAGPIEAELLIELDPLPQAVASRAGLRRGHRITAADLTTVPIPHSQWRDAYVVDPESLIGQEVFSPVRSGHPIQVSDVRRPVLIKRGDLVEVRVFGGGITVSTNAKSLGEGGEMDLVQVETFDPKRKLIARVVEPGLVEVISRAPGVSR